MLHCFQLETVKTAFIDNLKKIASQANEKADIK